MLIAELLILATTFGAAPVGPPTAIPAVTVEVGASEDADYQLPDPPGWRYVCETEQIGGGVTVDWCDLVPGVPVVETAG